MRRYKTVLVEWHDVFDGGAEWTHPETPDPKPVLVRTVGFLKAEAKKHITIARDYYDEGGRRVHGGLIAIPRGMIVRIVELGSV